MTKKVSTNLNIFRAKKDFNMKQKAFFITFECLSLKQIKPNFLEGESPNLSTS